MIYRGDIEILIGIALLVFYLGLGIYLWKTRNADEAASSNKEVLIFFAKIALTVLVVVASGYIAVIGGMILISEGVHQAFAYVGMLVVPSLCLPLIWLKKKKKFLIIWLIPAVIYFVSLGVHYGLEKYDQSITVNTAPNINVHEYLPFREDSKIVKIDSKTLKLTDNLVEKRKDDVDSSAQRGLLGERLLDCFMVADNASFDAFFKPRTAMQLAASILAFGAVPAVHILR